MVSYEELIYHFTDIYLEPAMKCSICKENYLMTDDQKFLDDFMKFFSSLVLVVDQNPDMELKKLDMALEAQKEETLRQFWIFLKHQIAQQAIEYADNNMKNPIFESQCIDVCYPDIIKEYTKFIFDEKAKELAEEPIALLKHIREREEKFKKESRAGR